MKKLEQRKRELTQKLEEQQHKSKQETRMMDKQVKDAEDKLSNLNIVVKEKE